jgi:hypothetical protein
MPLTLMIFRHFHFDTPLMLRYCFAADAMLLAPLPCCHAAMPLCHAIISFSLIFLRYFRHYSPFAACHYALITLSPFRRFRHCRSRRHAMPPFSLILIFAFILMPFSITLFIISLLIFFRHFADIDYAFGISLTLLLPPLLAAATDAADDFFAAITLIRCLRLFSFRLRHAAISHFAFIAAIIDIASHAICADFRLRAMP